MKHAILGRLITVTSLLFQGAALGSSGDELSLIATRRIADLAQFPDPPWFSRISDWLGSQKEDGTWDDVNYLAGCPAQRANWPIEEHWNRLITFAAAWSGANPSVPTSWNHSDELLAALSRGLDYWFDNDYEPADCMGNGGQAKGCPCGTPGLWNTNWYDQAILVPQLCSTTCLLLRDARLSEKQQAGCRRIPGRAYDLRDGQYGTGGYMTGANTDIGDQAVLVMQNSVSLALYTNNATVLRDAFSRAMKAMTFADKPRQDGIHRDGTFLQHAGVLYNGNYGKDLLNAFVQLEGEAIGTSFAAGNATRQAMAALAGGDEWMIYTDCETRQEHWDFTTIGRFAAFPTTDLQASADINFNVSKLAVATADFTGENDVRDTVRRLKSNGTEKLVGNRGFWASDYMVHRRERYVLTSKMLSTRSANSESVNGANPYGYHLGQGTLFSYVEGNEYRDIEAAWDWNLIPGTTTLLNKPGLSASSVKHVGRKDFVGVVSDGTVGTAVQDYEDPLDGGISYQKAWFFLDDSVLVTITNIKTNASGANPPITVLDNRASVSGKVWVDAAPIDAAKGVKGSTLFYGGNGYMSYEGPFNLTVFEGKRVGNWSAISTSKLRETTVSIFSAYTTVTSKAFSYAMFPASSRRRLAQELKKPTSTPIVKDGITGAAGSGRLSLVFWPGSANSITVGLARIGWAEAGSVTVDSDQPAAYLFAVRPGSRGPRMRLAVTLSDPTQEATSASFALRFSKGRAMKINSHKGQGASESKDGVSFRVDLPGSGLAGSSISREIYVDWSR